MPEETSFREVRILCTEKYLHRGAKHSSGGGSVQFKAATDYKALVLNWFRRSHHCAVDRVQEYILLFLMLRKSESKWKYCCTALPLSDIFYQNNTISS